MNIVQEKKQQKKVRTEKKLSEFVQGNKYVWLLPETEKKLVADIALKFNLSFPVSQTLIHRGYKSSEVIEEFLFSSYERDVSHASQLKDADKAVDRILQAINTGEQILVAGDYDVDGITSSAMMMASLLPLGAKINFFLPNRVRDGYGLSNKIIERAAENNYKVVVTVDNGITAFEPAKLAKKLGIDLIITDHHRQHDVLPDAFAIVNPNRNDCEYPFKSLAGVGVTFKLLSLLYERKGLELPSKVYELLLLGTVADVVPLLGENRFWVRFGLNYINKTESLSLKTLKQNGKVTKSVMSSTDIGFSIAPQINALGRLQDSRQAVKFLIGTDTDHISETGRLLFELNEARKKIERAIFDEVNQKVQNKEIDLEKENVIIATGKSWAPGVIGLVASRLVSAYGKPTLLFHETKEGLVKGSCRSIQEFDMFNALTECKELLLQFGGHSLAAGLSLKKENLPKLKAYLETLVSEQLTEFDLRQKLSIDAVAQLGDFTKKFIGDLHHLEPFGNQNSEPVFYIENVVQVQKPKLLKDLHVKAHVFADGIVKPIMFFNRPELYELLSSLEQEPFDIAAKVSENHWNGRVNIELFGVDIAIK